MQIRPYTMTKFVPDNFKPRESDIEWAMKKFNISRDEVDNQLEEFIDHEFKRSYTDWNRCFRNWFRTAEKYSLLKREFKHRRPEELSTEELERDRIKSVAEMDEYRKRR